MDKPLKRLDGLEERLDFYQVKEDSLWYSMGGLKMADLRLVSTRKCQLKPLVEGALFNELRLLEAGIRRTEQRLLEFEGKYHLGTQEFISRYENDKMEETTNFDEWIGEFRMLTRLREKADTLRGIRFAN